MSMPPTSPASPRVSLQTLGCKLNYAETSAIAKGFLDRGYTVVGETEQTDVLVLNTCSVTANAERECRQIVRRTRRNSPDTVIAVTGCYAQLRPQEIAAIPGVDAVFGAEEKFEIYDRLAAWTKGNAPKVYVGTSDALVNYHGAASSVEDSRSRSFLKVQDGCDYSCSYCTIPAARGRSRSATISDIVEQVRRLSVDGFHEIVLSGVNVGEFGSERGEELFELLVALDRDPEVTARLRISSIEPNLLTKSIIEFVGASQKFCPHFHIPLQSGSPTILRAMQRRYRRELYQERIELIKASMPDACIGADVIAGFPGESEEAFRETLEFLDALPISYLHVFTYSERPGTKAMTLPGSVPMSDRRARNQALRVLSDQKARAFYDSLIGKELVVILDREVDAKPWREGYSANYVRVRVVGAPGDAEVVSVRAERVGSGAVEATLLRTVSTRRHIPLAVL